MALFFSIQAGSAAKTVIGAALVGAGLTVSGQVADDYALRERAYALAGNGQCSAAVSAFTQLGRNGGDARLTGIVSDIMTFAPTRQYALWHDRAVLHFLTEEADRAAYRAALMAGLAPGGHLLVATFAPDGPEKCSGLPVRRYGLDDFEAFFGPEFSRVSEQRFTHVTPSGAEQRFQAAHYRRER